MLIFSNNNLQSDLYYSHTPIIDNGQQNLLIMTIDRLASVNPEIKSIWLLITYPELYKLILVPIYSAIQENPTIGDVDLEQAFALTENKTIDPEFSDMLHERFHWDYYLIVDHKRGSIILKILAQIANGFHIEDDQTPQVLLPHTGVEMDRSLYDQVQLWDGVCLELSKISNPEELDNLFRRISPYIHTDLRWEEFLHQWSFDQPKSHQINCEFPTLTLNSP